MVIYKGTAQEWRAMQARKAQAVERINDNLDNFDEWRKEFKRELAKKEYIKRCRKTWAEREAQMIKWGY